MHGQGPVFGHQRFEQGQRVFHEQQGDQLRFGLMIGRQDQEGDHHGRGDHAKRHRPGIGPRAIAKLERQDDQHDGDDPGKQVGRHQADPGIGVAAERTPQQMRHQHCAHQQHLQPDQPGMQREGFEMGDRDPPQGQRLQAQPGRRGGNLAEEHRDDGGDHAAYQGERHQRLPPIPTTTMQPNAAAEAINK